jgi:hypothetical protein
MCRDVGMEALGDIVARLVDDLVVRPGEPADARIDNRQSGASTLHQAFPLPSFPSDVALRNPDRVSTSACRRTRPHHSAEAELNFGNGARAGEESDTSAAQAQAAGDGRAHRRAASAGVPSATILEWKRPGAGAPGKVSARGYREQGGTGLTTAMPGSARHALRR